MRSDRLFARRPATLLARVLSVVLSLLLPQAAWAGTGVTLFNSFAGNINFVTTGNTLRAGDNTNSTTACALVSGQVSTTANAGTDNGTVSGIPAGSSIVAAYLYYAGSSATIDSTVTFNGNNLTASRTFNDSTHVPWYGGFVDVTSLVSGNGSYSFGGLVVDNTQGGAYCGNQTLLAGWALVVIYSNPSESYRVVNVYDGFQIFQNSSITLTPANFKVPSPALPGSKFAVITWEGDSTLSGNETLTFNGTTLTDACNGTNNQYNSTINTLTCTGTAATDDVYYGVDIDTFGVDSSVAAGQTSATTFYQSGGDTVILTAQVISITDAPVSDLSISKVHNGTFGYGDNGSYTITVTNNGPTATSGTSKVTDTLPAGETYVSATGTGWTCSAVGQAVTCTSTSVVANGASFNPITLTVAVATSAGTSLANTATAAVDAADFDNDSTNNSSTDTVSNANGGLLHPDLSTSTKTVFNPGGGDYNVGDTVQYTITLNESAGVDASSVSVTDNVPANLSGFTASAVTVTGSSTTITNSSTNTGGTNADGLVSISNITVPANGSVTIVFTAQVKAGTANCATINNTGSISYAGGSPTTATVTAPTITIAQSACASNGNKILYVYDNTGPTYNDLLNRVVQTANTGTGITINGGANHTWTLAPAAAKNLVLTAGTVSVALIISNTNAATGTRRATTVSLLNNGVVVATSGSVNTNNAAAAIVVNYTITIPATTVLSGNTLALRLNNNATANDHILVSQKTAALTSSRITFATSTVVNVDSVTAYNAVYPAITQTTVYSPGSQVFICAVISDPFGSYDAASANITITDANGNTALNGATPVLNLAMTAKGATNCAGTASGSTEAYEYTYTIPAAGTAAVGNWTATVTGNEGTEGTVSHTANGTFEVNVPALTIMKTVLISTDPVEGATRAKAIPGATAQYTITVLNSGRGTVDAGTMVISDPVPTNTVLSLPAKPPFTFTDGAASSGLTVGANDTSITYTDHSNAAYTPTCTRPCTDSNIGGFTITLNGTMNGKTGASAPSFTISFQVVIQ
jgi:fimbrial isopeptide formation D2 family protein/uncharacterized repeat protein (TIGR01451 family)